MKISCPRPLDDGAIMRGFSPRRWTRPMRCDLIVNLLFIVAEPAHFFDNSFFFYGSLLEPLHSFIAEIPVQPQVLVYLFRPGTSGKERSSELTNITEPIISKHFCQREVGLPRVQDSGRGPSFVFCPIGRTTDDILELPF